MPSIRARLDRLAVPPSDEEHAGRPDLSSLSQEELEGLCARLLDSGSYKGPPTDGLSLRELVALYHRIAA